MKIKWFRKVVNFSLVIKNDDEIKDIQFLDLIPVTSVTVYNCLNMNFVRVPIKIIDLVVNNCDLTNVNGIELMV